MLTSTKLMVYYASVAHVHVQPSTHARTHREARMHAQNEGKLACGKTRYLGDDDISICGLRILTIILYTHKYTIYAHMYIDMYGQCRPSVSSVRPL